MARGGHPVFTRIWAFAMRRLQPPGIVRSRRLLADGLSGVVVEVGCGSGTMFEHYGPAVERVIAIEPEAYLREHASRAAAAAAVPVEVSGGDAESLPLGDGEADAVVCSMVLCSVPDQERALAEIVRVLRPGGRLHYYEHVADDPGTRSRAVQRWLDRTGIWPRLGAGCHCARDTGAAIRATGLEIVQERRANFGPPLVVPVRPHLLGVAEKR